MIRIGVTQRVINVPEINEKRDSLDQRWTNFLTELGFLPIMLPNRIKDIEKYLSELEIKGVLLTGGEDILEYATEEAANPERDRLEHALIEYCIALDLPMIGICRGFQSILNHFGGRLQSIENHVAVRHIIKTTKSLVPNYDKKIDVNSFHNLGILERDLPQNFQAMAWATDGTIEAAAVQNHNILGIMWHPEREELTAEWDKVIFTQIFGEINS
ncbi:MAG: gamma-glutamyl-gamma-aminobutyrate hydrolase family protein [Chloroflexota bacterium]|nr:gamma-glutamyl-gamma-aminobutyrate hydrolase family protein [Chloroflexota bacterium]